MTGRGAFPDALPPSPLAHPLPSCPCSILPSSKPLLVSPWHQVLYYELGVQQKQVQLV